MVRISVMKELRRSSLIVLRKSVCTCPLLFLTGFSFTNMMIHRTAGKGWVSLYPFYHFYLLQKHLDISQVVAAERTLLRIAGSRTRTGNLWFPSASRAQAAKHYATRPLKFTLSTLALVANIDRNMLKTRISLGNISLALLNLIKRFIFVMFNDSFPQCSRS